MSKRRGLYLPLEPLSDRCVPFALWIEWTREHRGNMGGSCSTGSVRQAPENDVHVSATSARFDSVAGNVLSDGEVYSNKPDSPLASSQDSPLSSSRSRRRRPVMSGEAYNNAPLHTGHYNYVNGKPCLPLWASSLRDVTLGERESSGKLVRGGTASLADLTGGTHSHLIPQPASSSARIRPATASSSRLLPTSSSSSRLLVASSAGRTSFHHRQPKMSSPVEPESSGRRLPCLKVCPTPWTPSLSLSLFLSLSISL